MATRTPEAAAVRRVALPLRHPNDLDPLLDRVGPARLVLVGEASHGTSEFYRWRAELTRRLVVEKAERWGNYVPTVLGRRYDAFLYCDHTSALRPLHPLEQPDTYPSGQ